MTELQTDSDAFFMLTQDDLAAFLSDTSTASDSSMDMVDWAFELVLPQSCGAPAKATPTRAHRTTRIRQRERLQVARDEVSSLQQQLQIMHENHELRVSLDRVLNQSSSGRYERAKFQALRERIHREQAEERNARLRQRVEANTTLLEQVSSLVSKQRELTPKALSVRPNFHSLRDDDSLVFQSLRARLDARYHQFDSILSRLDTTSSALGGRRTQAPWSVSASDRGISVDFSESFAMPFSLELIFDILSRHTSLSAIEVCVDNYVDNVSQTPMPSHMYPRDKLTSAREFERKIILRRVDDARGAILLWEGSSCWQANEDHQSQGSDCVVVRNSGWAVLSPLAIRRAEVSIAHYGCSMEIYSTDNARLKTSDVLVNCVVRSMRSLTESRNAYLENVMLDAYLEHARRRP